jgi:tRNA (guanine37-N1)-methyltransferase
MRIDIVTLFPRMFDGVLGESMLRVARERGAVTVRVRDLREHTDGRHRVADDYPFGGGGGMVLKPEPLFAAVEALREPASRVVLLCPQGERFTQAGAARLAGEAHVILLCGHYEGVDERVRLHLVDEEISIGDYVLTGGELPAMVVVDAVVRLLPGVLGDPEGASRESFTGGRLDYPQYTRPAEFRGLRVPEVLLSGDHARITRWRQREALRRTLARRPDLLEMVPLTPEERGWRDELMRSDELTRKGH